MKNENKRKENKPMKVSFNIAILVIIIMMLIGIIIWSCVIIKGLRNSNKQLEIIASSKEIPKEEKEEIAETSNNIEESENNTTEDTVAQVKELGHFNPSKGKNIEPGVTYETDAFIDIYNISVNLSLNEKNQVEVLVYDNGKESDPENFVKSMKRKKDVPEIMTGFSGKVEEIEIAEMGQEISNSYFLFLMEDGSVEYISIVDLLDTSNLASRGKLKGLENIVRVKNVGARESEGTGWATTLAFDVDGNFYDILNVLEKQNISASTVNWEINITKSRKEWKNEHKYYR